MHLLKGLRIMFFTVSFHGLSYYGFKFLWFCPVHITQINLKMLFPNNIPQTQNLFYRTTGFFIVGPSSEKGLLAVAISSQLPENLEFT